MHAAQAQHLRAVLGRGHMPHRLTATPHHRLLRAKVAVGVNLDLQAAVTEDALGHHSDQVHPARLRRHNERRRLVIRVSRRRPHPRHKHPPLRHLLPHLLRQGGGQVLRFACLAVDIFLQQHHRVQPHQHTLAIGVAVAGPRTAFGNLTQHRASIAFHLVARHELVAWRRTLDAQVGSSTFRSGQAIALGVLGHGALFKIRHMHMCNGLEALL